jgi:hypothetical protein
MKVELQNITIREVTEDYFDDAEEGVTGYDGKLNIRPKYQREFVYDDKKRNAVIDTIRKELPLNVLYWAKNDDGTFEVIDGQQRTISFCQYVTGTFSVDNRYFHSLTSPEQKRILDYELMIYFCEGDEEEKLNWFRTVNIAGERLFEQELRNAVYTGAWLSDAKSKFSKTGCAASLLAKDYVNGSPIRQDILETALRWKNKGEIEEYMSAHQHDKNADELWAYFRSVIEWVEDTFGMPKNYRKEMKGLDWGGLYDKFGKKKLNKKDLEQRVQDLMADEDVQSKKGIYEYVLTGNENLLNIRAFSDEQKRTAYEKQKGICKKCKKPYKFEEMQGDHIKPWSKGGHTVPENCQMLCSDCNRRKSAV